MLAIVQTPAVIELTPQLVLIHYPSDTRILPRRPTRALAPLFLYLIPVVIVAVVLLFFVIERPLATTNEGEIFAPSDDIVGGEADARAAATIAARENDPDRSTSEPVRAPTAADLNNLEGPRP